MLVECVYVITESWMYFWRLLENIQIIPNWSDISILNLNTQAFHKEPCDWEPGLLAP